MQKSGQKGAATKNISFLISRIETIQGTLIKPNFYKELASAALQLTNLGHAAAKCWACSHEKLSPCYQPGIIPCHQAHCTISSYPN